MKKCRQKVKHPVSFISKMTLFSTMLEILRCHTIQKIPVFFGIGNMQSCFCILTCLGLIYQEWGLYFNKSLICVVSWLVIKV